MYIQNLQFQQIPGVLKRSIIRLQFGRERRRELYREIISLMGAGFSRSEAISTVRLVAREGGGGSSAKAEVLSDVMQSIRNGLSFSLAMKKWVSQEEYMVLGALEEGDQFADNLKAYCETADRKAVLRAEIIGTLAYPVFLLSVSYGLLIYFATEIAPVLERLLPPEQWRGMSNLVREAGQTASGLLPFVVLASALLPLAIILVLPRWSRFGRSLADRLPVFALYRMHTGGLFLKSMASLMGNGLTATEAIERIRPTTSSYVGSRLDLIRFHLLNGADLGSAMHVTGTGWPDRQLNLTLKILSRTSDFAVQLPMITDNWSKTIVRQTKVRIAVLRAIAMILVFSVVSSVVMSMYGIQGQIASLY